MVGDFGYVLTTLLATSSSSSLARSSSRTEIDFEAPWELRKEDEAWEFSSSNFGEVVAWMRCSSSSASSSGRWSVSSSFLPSSSSLPLLLSFLSFSCFLSHMNEKWGGREKEGWCVGVGEVVTCGPGGSVVLPTQHMHGTGVTTFCRIVRRMCWTDRWHA